MSFGGDYFDYYLTPDDSLTHRHAWWMAGYCAARVTLPAPFFIL